MERLIKSNKSEILLGVLSDTHVPHRTSVISQKVIDDFRIRNVDYVLHLGDFTSYQAYQQLIKTFGKEKVIAIRGNMDFDKKLKTELPKKIKVEILNHKVLMVHGMGGPEMIIERLIDKFNLLNSEYDIVIFGHTHRALSKKRSGILFFNPGTAVKTDGGSYGYLIVSKNNFKSEIINF